MSTVPQKLGRYELRAQLGRGSVGELWKGYDLQFKHDVAVKIIHTDLQSDPSFMRRFTNEGQKIIALHHDNIVQVYEVAVAHKEGTTSTTAYVVSEYIEGQTLGRYMAAAAQAKGPLLSLPDIVYLFTSLGVAIDYAHQNGVIHGNVKPANVLLDQHHKEHLIIGEPMLTDVGMPLLLGETTSIASPHYMSPEQAKGDAPNNRSDIYALGVILYELCTGTKPFRNESSVAVMMQHIHTLPTPPILLNPQLPPALSEVILRAMAKDTATRYAMASLLATAIADACSIRSTITTPRIAEEESTYHTASGQYSSFLGVSHPTEKTPAAARPLVPTTPNVYTNPRTPTPQLPAATTAPSIANKQRMITPTPQTAITKKIPVPLQLGVPPTNSPNTPNLSNIPATPQPMPVQNSDKGPQQKPPQSSLVSHAYTPTETSPVLPSAVFPKATRSRTARFLDTPVYVVVAVCGLLLLLMTTVIGGYLLNSQGAANNAVVGHVFFQDDALGHADTLRFDINHIAPPPQDKVYQVWLQDTKQQMLPLGTLALNNDAATFAYAGTPQHTNLLSIVQGILVTTEDVGNKATKPKGDTVYKATFDTALRTALKNILYQTPNFPSDNGVVFGMYETIKSINEKAGSLVDSAGGTHDYALARRQATRILELIDGTNYARQSGDLPKDMPSQLEAKVGLLSSPTQKGYIDALTAQLDVLQPIAGDNGALQQHIQNIRSAIADLREWIQKIRSYDIPLVQAANVADPALYGNALQVKQWASDAYTGRTIPPNDGPRPILGSAGAYQAYVECQYLATMDMKKAA